MEERIGEAFTLDELLTVVGRKLLPGEAASAFSLDYLDLADMTVQSVELADIEGSMSLFNVVNSLTRSICQRVTVQWEKLRTDLPSNARIYTISMDPPDAQAHWQSIERILYIRRFLPTVVSSSDKTTACGSRNGACSNKPSL